MVLKLVSSLGEWLVKSSRRKNAAIALVILALISPLGFIFAASMIAYFYQKSKKKR
ncbi:MAG: hypothetical protein HYW23_03270 [Candidatus Aenigmarchaeota archaeon]|nr:hypothetical protein [Candidatus Aenigmarchaeota archaeon]